MEVREQREQREQGHHARRGYWVETCLSACGPFLDHLLLGES
jgi:hypothetical protein